MWFFQNPEIIFYHFFCIFNLDIFWVLILQKRMSRYLDPVTPTTVLSRSFWNFTGALRMVWRYVCGFFRILKLFFITGFLLQYLGKWYRTNGPLVNFTIFNTSNKNKAGNIRSPWYLLVYFYFFFFGKQVTLHANCLHWRKFAWNVESCFMEKGKKNVIKPFRLAGQRDTCTVKTV